MGRSSAYNFASWPLGRTANLDGILERFLCKVDAIKMRSKTIVASLLFVVPILTQTTPDGFLLVANKTLDVYYGGQYISPGTLVKKSGMPNAKGLRQEPY